jgi:IstB-like ATP binding protein
VTETLDRIRASLVGLRMPRALEALDHAVRRLERGEISALEAIDGLLAEEHATREGRRIGVALKTARLTPPKTLESFDFACPRSTATGSSPSPSWTSSAAPKSSTSSARPEPARATWPPPSASPP